MATIDTSHPEIDVREKILQALKKNAHMPQIKWADDITLLKIFEIGDGNLNDVFRVYRDDTNTNTVVLKHAPPYIKCLGKDYPLCEERGLLEFKAMCRFDSVCPGSVPKPLFYDETLRVIGMEDLRDYAIYRNLLIDGILDDDAALKLARDVAVIHRDTHVAKIGEEALQQMDKDLPNPELIALTEQYVFTGPFKRDDPTNQCSDSVKARLDWLYGDPDVLKAASNMKKIFLKKKEALVHGDLHTGSIMVKDKDSKIIDMEFAYVGPCAMDLGFLIANYIFSYYRHLLCLEDNESHRVFAYRIVDICNKTIDEYFKHMTSIPGDTESYQANFMSEVAGFAGCEILRRLVGAAHVADFNSSPAAEVDALGAGVRLLKAYHRIHSIGTLLVIGLMLAF